jgi:hypothetical protein
LGVGGTVGANVGAGLGVGYHSNARKLFATMILLYVTSSN